mmetsp:Transcript_3628/g.5093  ORF Transcript_3628/g.5093 Transcript_3628/m.5093 type:complete len:112 (-) Transcript_3628:215-550(-)
MKQRRWVETSNNAAVQVKLFMDLPFLFHCYSLLKIMRRKTDYFKSSRIIIFHLSLNQHQLHPLVNTLSQCFALELLIGCFFFTIPLYMYLKLCDGDGSRRDMIRQKNLSQT